MLSWNDLTEAARACERLSIPGVHAVGVGCRESSGGPHTERAVRLYVHAKRSRSVLGLHRAPRLVDGVPTDVVVQEPPGMQSVLQRMRRRPLRMGDSVGDARETAGTLGAVVEREGHPGTFVLSCSHVLAPPGASRNDRIRQPASLDDVGGPDWIGNLDAWTSISMGFANNRVDAAIARLSPLVRASNDIPRLGRPSRTHVLRPGSPGTGTPVRVAKVGRSTGYTEGVVVDWRYAGSIQVETGHGSRLARFVDQLQVRAAPGYFRFTEPGDSGALVLELGSKRAIGLVIAGRGSTSIVTPIYNVLEVDSKWSLKFK